MKHFTLKAMCVMLTLCYMLASWSAEFVSNGIKYSINNNGTSVTVVANTYEGDIVIPTTVESGGTTYNVTAIGNSAFSGCKDMTSITLNEGLATIGSFAFQNCEKLKTLTLPNSVTEIGREMCVNCKVLESVVIGDGLKSIPYGAFYGLGSLESVTFGSKVETIGQHAFASCSFIKTIQCFNQRPAT